MGEKMMYDTILARSFSRYDQKKLGYGAFLGCLLIALSFCTVLKPYLGPIPVLNMRLSTDIGLKILRITDSASSLKLRDNDTGSFMRIIVNETSSSETEMVVENDTSSSNDTISRDISSFTMVVNDTTSSSPQGINYTLGTNERIRNDSFNTNTAQPVDVDASMSSSKTLEINYTSSFSNVNSSNKSVPVVNDRSSSSETVETNSTNSSQHVMDVVVEKMKPLCHVAERTEFCEMNGDIRVDGKSSTVLMAASMVENSSRIIKPYARKGDEEALNHVTGWTVKSVVDGYALPQCHRNHKVPAIIFSLGGYAGNNFHDYTDVVIPLYLTSRQFDGEVKFLITNKNPGWVYKFRNVLQKLSRYELINIDEEESVHCFTSVIVGLKRNPKELKIDLSSSNSPYSMNDFRQFLRSAYSLKRDTVIKMKDTGGKRRPRILILSRKRTRAFTNTNGIARMARRLGYKVVVAEADSNVARFAEIVNSCDVMMGVHGAGLTNMVFLPKNAILIQVVPIGGFEWLARSDFEEPSKDMNLRYLEYKIQTQESSLIQQYPPDHEVLRNPYAIQKQGWYAFKSIYLQKQNVNLDVNRFTPTLLRALELLHQQ
ncbi:hypothetical protein PTKIN_Ptkin04bG0109200 [Pterospermum kingtungense]